MRLLRRYKTGGIPRLSHVYRIMNQEETDKAVAQLVDTFCRSVEMKDPYTRGHSERVTAYLLFIAEKVFGGLSEHERATLKYAGLLHDIGKIHIPDEVLKKPGRLTEEELAWVRQHPEIGANIISQIPSLSETVPIILHHHERFDGRGYPFRLQGKDIPLEARIAALADTMDAMASSRSYRGALSFDEVLQEMINHSGTQFDPVVVTIAIREYDGLRKLHEELQRIST